MGIKAHKQESMTKSFTRRTFLKTASAALLAPHLLRAAGPSKTPERPDVVFLIIEDCSPIRMGCYGNAICKTPNIDRLAATGLRFTNAHTTPPCSPSRTSLLSGIRPETSRCFDNGQDELCRNVLSSTTPLPLNFRQHGYDTVKIGKMGHPEVDEWWTSIPEIREASREQLPPRGPATEDGAMRAGARFEYGPTGLDDLEDGDGRFATAAIETLRQKRDNPLFLTVGFHGTHLPFRAPDKFFAMYPPEDMPIPKNPGSGEDLMPTAETWERLRAEPPISVMGPANPHTLRQWQEAIAAHYASLSYVDAQVGRILDEIEKSGRADNTLVVLWSDHGFALGEDWYWRKGPLRDNSTKCAMIVRAPGLTTPGVCNRVTECMDLHPTFLELCGLPNPPGMEAVSMVPLLKDPARPWKKAALIYREKGEAVGVSTERYRLNIGPELELFDHATDPGELRNLAASPENAPVVAELRQLAESGWRACVPPLR